MLFDHRLQIGIPLGFDLRQRPDVLLEIRQRPIVADQLVVAGGIMPAPPSTPAVPRGLCQDLTVCRNNLAGSPLVSPHEIGKAEGSPL